MAVAGVQRVRFSSVPAYRRFGVLAAAATVIGAAGASQAQTPSPKTADFSASQAKRGAEFYAGSCAMCHGDTLDDGQFAPALKGPVHAAYWRGKTAADVFTYMASMMPPTQPGGLGAQAYADIMAYLLQADHAPASDKELPADPATLRSAAATP